MEQIKRKGEKLEKRYAEYESFKKRLYSKGLDHEQYEEEIKKYTAKKKW